MKNNETFNWVSQLLFEYADKVQLTKTGVYLETGVGENDTNQLTYTPTRVSFKIKDVKTNNKLEYELGYSDLFLLIDNLRNFSNKKIQTIEFKLLTKNKVRTLNFYHTANEEIFKFVLTDNNSTVQSICSYFNKPNIVALASLLIGIKDNWATVNSNIQNLATSQKTVKEISNINTNISNLITVQSQTNIALNLLISKLSDVQSAPISTPVEVVIKPTEEIKQEEIIDVPWDVDSVIETPKDYVKKHNPYQQASSIFTINDDDLNSINLDPIEGFGERVPYTTVEDVIKDDEQFDIDGFEDKIVKSEVEEKIATKKTVNPPRPFLNNFLNWDLNQFQVWIDGFVAADFNSSTLTLMPIELILTKSLSKENFQFLKSDKNYIGYQIYTLENIKNLVLSYIKTGKGITPKNYKFENVTPISKNTNKPMWDFIVDIFTISSVYKYFSHNLKSFSGIDADNSLTDIKMTESIFGTFIYTFIDMIDKSDKDAFLEDAIDLLSNLLEKDTLDHIKNTYSKVTKGGTLQLDLVNLNPFLDKYIEFTFNYNKFQTDDIPNVNDLSQIKGYLELKYPKPVKDKDPQLKLFLKYIKNEKLESKDYSTYIEFKRLDLSDESNLEIIDLYKTIKNNPNVTRVRELKEVLKNNIQITVTEATPKIEKPQNTSSVWDLSDSVSDDIFNAFLN